MKYELISIETCTATIAKSKIVTLNQYPNAWERFCGKAPEQVRYQGTQENWFKLPELRPCNPTLTQLLNTYCKK